MKKCGFTLIELLVVIAIIAILAAILFPVFAQAKRAAKGAVAISGAKQMALGQLMYSIDSDDNFSPVVSTVPAGWGSEPFSFLQQPYMKSWQLLLDPTGPITSDDLTASNAGYGWEVYGLWGMPPTRSSTISTKPEDWTFGQQTLGAQMTGGQLWYYDGIGGAGMGPNQGAAWPLAGYKSGSNPSLSTTAVASPADQVMIAQSANYDFMWQMTTGYGDLGNANDTPDNFDLYFGACNYNTYGCNVPICGPMARKRDSDGPSSGFIPNGFNGSSFTAQATQLPTGLTVWAGVDGHVAATPWRKLMGTTIPIAGGKLAIKAFWPAGS